MNNFLTVARASNEAKAGGGGLRSNAVAPMQMRGHARTYPMGSERMTSARQSLFQQPAHGAGGGGAK